MNEHEPIYVSTNILTFNEKNQVLLGKRKNAFASGEYGIPSGHMENGETFTQAAIREFLEETGNTIKEDSLKLFSISNYIIKEWNRQYITFDFVITVPSDSIKTMEQDKNEGWKWYDAYNLPSPLHFVAERTINQYKQFLIEKTIIIS